ncbi:MAG: HD domain-containing phosphohydrolase, partial [Nitrolancea sp.]
MALLVVIGFLILFSLGVRSRYAPPTAGVQITWSASSQAWTISRVHPLSSSYDAGVRIGDVVTSIDGQSLPNNVNDQINVTEIGSHIEVIHPGTGNSITVDAGESDPDWNLVLLCSVVFAVVGIAVLLVGDGSAPRALSLACVVGALELAVLPSMYRLSSWSIPIHAVLLALAFSSFAYLFLVFPIKREFRVRNLTIPASVVPFTAIPFAAFWYYSVQIAPENYGRLRLWGFPYLVACLLIGVGSLIYGWRTTRGQREHTQIRIVVLSSIAAVLPFVLLSAIPEAVAGTYVVHPKYSMLALVLLPLSFGYAILRYQIMDLQLYIRRGIVYSVLALVVTGIYALILFIGTTIIQHQVGMNDAFVLAVSGTIVAIIFQRLRDELQRLVDRAFDRSHYDYRTQLLEFSRRMTEHLESEDLGKLTATLISQTLEPTHVRMYMFDSAAQVFRLSAGVGVPASNGWQELSLRHPIIVGLEEAGGLRQRFDASADDAGLSILLEKDIEVVGLLILGPKKADLPYSSEDISLLKTVANQLAVAADNSRLYERTRDLYLSSIRTLAATVDAKDPYTHGHSERVSAYARSIAGELDLQREDVEAIELAGLLHDIGKIGIPDSVLQKPGRLDPDERALIMEHAALGAKIISENPSLMPLAPLVRHHH